MGLSEQLVIVIKNTRLQNGRENRSIFFVFTLTVRFSSKVITKHDLKLVSLRFARVWRRDVVF